MNDIQVSNRSELLSALDDARGGETIVLAEGSYGSLDLSKDYSALVTVRSEEPLEAQLSGIRIAGGSNLKFDGVEVANGSNGSPGGSLVRIEESAQDIQIVNSEISGLVDNVYTGQWGIFVRGSRNISLVNNDVSNVQDGIVAFGVSNLDVVDNNIDFIGSDAMKFAGIRDGLIDGNVGGGNVMRVAGTHTDFIQFQGSSSDLVITENVFLAKTVSNVQGIFLSGGSYQDVYIAENVINTGMIRGISVSAGSGILIEDNTLINVPNEVHSGTMILSPGTIQNNIMMNYAAGMRGSNLVLQNQNPNGDFYVEDFIQNGADGRGLTLGEIRLIPGSLAEGRGADLIGLAAGGGSGSTPPRPAPDAEPEPQPGPTTPPDLGEADIVFSRPGDTEFSGAKTGIISLPNSPALALDEGTVAFGFNADTVNGTRGLLSKDGNAFSGGGNHFTAALSNGTLNLLFENERSGVVLSANNIRPDTDYQVAMTFDGDEVRFYLNGDLVGARDFDMDWTGNVQPLRIGGTGWSGAADNSFDGTISDVVIADAALAPDQFDFG